MKPSLIQILPNSGWDCFQVWFPKLLIGVGGSLSSGSSGTNKTQTGHKIRQGSNPFNKPGFQGQIPKLLSRMAPSSGIYHDFDYSDLVTSSYFLGTHHHHEFINLQLGHNINYTKPKRLLFRGLTEVNVHYQSFPELETSPPGNTRNTANSEVPQYFWDPAPLSPNLARKTVII